MKQNGGKIAIYSRKSRFTGKGESIGNQIELCRDYVRSVFGEADAARCVVFEDEGFSGGNLKRPDFQRMMEGVRKREFQAIIVYRLDRISRNISDFTTLIDELIKLDVSFVSIREQFDTGTPMGRAMMFIISVFSQLERETIAERIRDNMHELAKTGRWLGGNTPTGFTSESVRTVTVDGRTRKACKLKPLPEEAAVVRTIFDIYTETDSLTATETELLRRRIKTRTGRDHTRFSIKGILQNPVYMTADEDAYAFFTQRDVEVFSRREAFDGRHGIMAYNRTDQEKGRAAANLPMQEWIIAVGRHPGLIPAKQWIGVQNSLERNRSKAYRKPRSNEALLTGLLFCSCGERMYPKLTNRQSADGSRSFTYVCKMKERSKGERCSCPNANGNALDAAVMEQIRLLDSSVPRLIFRLERSHSTFTEGQAQSEMQLTALRTELAENQKKIGGQADTLLLLEDSPAKLHIAKRIEQLHEANRSIENRIQELEALTSANMLTESEFNMLRQQLSEFREIVKIMSVEEKRELIRAAADRIIWNGTEAHMMLFGSQA